MPATGTGIRAAAASLHSHPDTHPACFPAALGCLNKKGFPPNDKQIKRERLTMDMG